MDATDKAWGCWKIYWNITRFSWTFSDVGVKPSSSYMAACHSNKFKGLMYFYEKLQITGCSKT